MGKILLILKMPFLDRIPSLKTLIMSLANSGYKITILTSESLQFTVNSFGHSNIKFIKIAEKTHKFACPISIKLLYYTIRLIFKTKFDYIIGGDCIGNIIASKVSKFFKKKYIFFALEYPQIITKKHPKLSVIDRQENKALTKADLIITHDQWHKTFLINNFKLEEKKILLLPNASLTPEYNKRSNYLRDILNIPSSYNIVLHSGGFGEWFRCKELANCTSNWDEKIKLIFHLSHRLENDPYFESIYKHDYEGKIAFSLKPVDTYELDTLVASADIGIALYSEDKLGYRATYMGLASGKIGNYLKCGVPVIATKLPSLSYIEDFKCGILVTDESEIINAIHTILNDHQHYSLNAHKCYKELWYPEKYLNNILNTL